MVRDTLLTRGWISPEDTGLYRICREPAEAVRVIEDFYRLYHSSRYVRDDLVIRLRKPIAPADLERLNREFARLVASGSMVLRGPYDVEDDHLDLPRLAFTHTRRDFGLLRTFIDRLNACEPA
jgi:hypothetical protein